MNDELKKWLIFGILTFCSIQVLLAQDNLEKSHRTGQWYIYWGWNNSQYTKSDIGFKGADHDFILRDVVADDRQTSFTIKKYFHPEYFTTPQYNVRIGKYLKNNWDLSVGIDHMKYVVRQGQRVNIEGNIDIPNSEYSETYAGTPINVQKGFLELEHTDGLNYINFTIRKNIRIAKGKLALDAFYGTGLGFLLPKSDITLINKTRNDGFHLSGYGVDINTGLRLTFKDRLFIQSELKTGFINLPSIRTTENKSDSAKQNFGFFQYNIVFGGNVFLKKSVSQE